MTQGGSPPPKKIPTIAPSAQRPKVPTTPPSAEPPKVAPAKAPAPPPTAADMLPWPAAVPPLIVALEIIRGRCRPPPELKAATETFLRSLTFVESAALHAAQSSEELDA